MTDLHKALAALNYVSPDEQPEEDQIRELEISQAYAAIFDTEHGRKALDDLKSWTVDATTWAPGMGHDRGYFREGQNAIVRYILSRILHAKQ